MVRGGRPLVRWFYSAMFAPYGDRLGAGSGRGLRLHGRAGELRRRAGGPAGGRVAAAGAGRRRLHGRAEPLRVEAGPATRTSIASPRPSSPSTSPGPRPDLPLPADLAGLPRPIFGYYGAVDERLDYDLIAAAGRRDRGRLGRPGRADDQGRPGGARRAAEPALPRPESRTPSCRATSRAFDVCLMPWALNEATRTISPTKTLEYMAGGKPIVSTAVRDVVRDHGDLVFVADDPEHSSSWRSTADRALRRRPRRGRAASGPSENGWDATAEAMRRLRSSERRRGRRGRRRRREGLRRAKAGDVRT